MEPPSFFPPSDLLSDPLVSVGLTALTAQAGYYAAQWMLGGREGRAKAAVGFEKTLIAAVIFGLALAVPALLSIGINTFLDLANIDKTKLTIYSLLTTKDYTQFSRNIQLALEAAARIYARYFDEARNSLAAFFGAVTGTGVLPWTQALSMAIVNVMTVAVSVLGSVLVSAAVYGVAAAVAKGWPAFMPLGALLITHERSRNIGALLLAVGSVMPVVLALGADVVYHLAPPRSVTWEHLLGIVGPVWDVVKAMVMLGLVGVAATALTYAFTKIFDEVGSHFSID